MNERTRPPCETPPRPPPAQARRSADRQGTRPRVPARRARNPGDAAAAAAGRADADDLPLLRGGAGLVVLRPARRSRGRAGQDRARRPRQGHPAARSRQDRRDPRRRGRPREGGRRAVGARSGRGAWPTRWPQRDAREREPAPKSPAGAPRSRSRAAAQRDARRMARRPARRGTAAAQIARSPRRAADSVEPRRLGRRHARGVSRARGRRAFGRPLPALRRARQPRQAEGAEGGDAASA